jgi:hypothetical protein
MADRGRKGNRQGDNHVNKNEVALRRVHSCLNLARTSFGLTARQYLQQAHNALRQIQPPYEGLNSAVQSALANALKDQTKMQFIKQALAQLAQISNNSDKE